VLDALRLMACLLWAACFFTLLGSATRILLGRPRERDAWWGTLWQVSALLFAWGIRNVTLGPPLAGPAAIVTSGLLVLQSMIAIGLLRRRFEYERWRL